MKRREDDDKFMGRPMFPRLHINDTEKGGPRAPPRNKMALYEQLTTPSQSHNPGGAVPPTLNPNSNIGLVPFNSRNQGMDRERRIHLPLYQQPLPPSYSHEELQGTEVVNLSDQPAQMQNRMKPVEEDDLVVPIFSHCGVGPCTGTTQNSGDEERSTHQRANLPTMLLNNGGKRTNHNNGKLMSRQCMISQVTGNLRVSGAPKRHSEISKREKDGVQRGKQDKCILSGSEVIEVCLGQDLDSGLPAMETRFGEVASDQPLESTQKDISLRLKHNPCIGYGCKDTSGFDNGLQAIDDCSPEMENVDRDDDMSETSMLDSASALDVSADDVVGIMGVKNFWRARSAIANHQRVLAAQVFELHRLMKVQGLIAGSPQLLLEDSAFMDNTSLKDSNVKYSSELAVRALAHTPKKKDASQEPRDKLERTAENAVSKAPPVLVPSSSPSVNTDPKMNPWSFHQPPSHQWLVPVMCPSEGLVYKPCPSSGFVGQAFGGHGPLGPTPMVSNLMNPAYGMSLGIHYGGQGYFPPYGMPIISPNLSGLVMDQMNQFSWRGPCGQIGRPAGVSTKSSCNGPIQKNGMTMPGAKDGELQRSTASSPSEQARGPGTADLTKGRDALPLFSVSTVTEISLGVPSKEKPSGVIRVVPRDRGSTRESAARIFQSIQEERRQQGSN